MLIFQPRRTSSARSTMTPGWSGSCDPASTTRTLPWSSWRTTTASRWSTTTCTTGLSLAESATSSSTTFSRCCRIATSSAGGSWSSSSARSGSTARSTSTKSSRFVSLSLVRWQWKLSRSNDFVRSLFGELITDGRFVYIYVPGTTYLRCPFISWISQSDMEMSRASIK